MIGISEFLPDCAPPWSLLCREPFAAMAWKGPNIPFRQFSDAIIVKH